MRGAGVAEGVRGDVAGEINLARVLSDHVAQVGGGNHAAILREEQ